MLMATRLKIPHTFVIHTYTKPTKCHFCTKILVGVFKQVRYLHLLAGIILIEKRFDSLVKHFSYEVLLYWTLRFAILKQLVAIVNCFAVMVWKHAIECTYFSLDINRMCANKSKKQDKLLQWVECIGVVLSFVLDDSYKPRLQNGILTNPIYLTFLIA